MIDIQLTTKREFDVYDYNGDNNGTVVFSIGPLEVTMDYDVAKDFANQILDAAGSAEDDVDQYAKMREALPKPPGWITF